MTELLPDTHQKALAINLNASIYGTIAEIGAGQEVARWFLRVGGASGTVAKTISAYDMGVSDAIYGKANRYVSRDRVLGMLEHEFGLLKERLGATRGQTAALFAFADTISARNFSGTNDCHGWLGIRFQRHPGGPANDLILHVNLRDATNVQQQEAVGVLGTNLIWAISQPLPDAEALLRILQDGLGSDRIEIDVIQITAPDLPGIDARRIPSILVAKGYAPVVHAPAGSDLARPLSEICYKRAVVVVPLAQESLVVAGYRRLVDIEKDLRGGLATDARAPALVLSTSVRLIGGEGLDPDAPSRLLAMQATGAEVLLCARPELYLLSTYVRRYSSEAIRFGIGAATLARILDQRVGTDQDASLLANLGALLGRNVRLTVWPMHHAAAASGGLDNQTLTEASRHVLGYLRSAGFLHELTG